MRRLLCGLIGAGVVMAGAACAQTPDWPAITRADAKALHDIVMDSHPGVFDADNPGFKDKVDAGLAEAEARAAVATDAADWWWTMRAYVAGFDDGHMQIGQTNKVPQFPNRWAGFLTDYRNGDHVVVMREDGETGAPPPGAKLIGCDGTDAARLAENRLAPFRGRWFLEAQRVKAGYLLFADISNRYAPLPKVCTFTADGVTETYALRWRDIDPKAFNALSDKALKRRTYSFDARTVSGGGLWYALPSFDGSPSSDAYKALTAIVTGMTRDQNILRQAPFIVLDVRGNGGGSSHWGNAMAEVIWGEDWMAAHALPPIAGIDWRASAANLAQMEAYQAEMRSAKASPEIIEWADAAVAGLRAARAAGQPYWHEGGDEAVVKAPSAPQRMRGRVYVLTDSVCASACLDAVDLWKAMGAIQVGRETSADTVYMEIRSEPLPSGLGTLSLPMKVWRGRKRGNNEPQRPDHVFDGDMSDDAAILNWLKAR